MLNTPATGKSLRERRNQKLNDLNLSINALALTEKQVNSVSKKRTRRESIGSAVTPLEFKSLMGEYEEGESPDKAFEVSYRVEQKIGEGAHGVVKKCFHRTTGKQFAVKIMKMEDEHYHGLKTNFINMKQLKHECIIKYKALYLNSKKRVCHLLMEYLPFGHLKTYMEEQELRVIFQKVLGALAYIHSKSICHRDIKPDNILYERASGLVKIIDFGISKNMKLRGRYEQMFTHTGTQYYKAPEMFLGGGYTQKVDSWAVGVSLYQLVTGVTPFESEYHSETIDNIMNKPVDIEYGRLASCSAIFKDLIQRLLKKDPKQRLSCTEAKDHIWFIPPLHYINAMKSDFGYNFMPYFKTEQKIDLQMMLKRRCSVAEIDPNNMQRVSKSQKQNMKRWLQIDSGKSTHYGQGMFQYDLSENDDEEEDVAAEKKVATVPSIQNFDRIEKEEEVGTVV